MSRESWDRRSPAARDREQDRLLAEWLTSEVVPFSPFWAERLRGYDVASVTDLAGVAATVEAELAAAGGPGNPGLLLRPTEDQFKRHVSRRDLLAAARELGGRRNHESDRRAVLFRRFQPVHVHEAGVASVLAIAYTRTDLDRLHLAGARLAEVAGLGADDALVNAVPAGPSVRFWGIYHAALAARMTALHPRGPGDDAVLSLHRALAMLPATVLAAPLDEAENLLRGLGDRGAVAPRLRTVLTVGPAPSAEQRERLVAAARALRAAPEVRVQAAWAPESARALWAECRPPNADPHEATYGFHTYPDLEVVEARDVETGQRAGDGQPGELLLTTLGWRGTALVRAATGTWTAGLSTGVPCPACGRTVPRVAPEAVDGAWQPRVPTSAGWRRVDLRRAPSALGPARLARFGISDWSLRLDGGVLTLAVDSTTDRVGLDELAAAVGRAVGVTPRVQLDPVAAASRPRLAAAVAELK